MKRIILFLENILAKHIDKLVHFLVCYAIVLTGDRFNALWFGILAALFLSVGKEVLDWQSYGKKMGWKAFLSLSAGDLVADVVGIVVAMGVLGLTAIGG